MRLPMNRAPDRRWLPAGPLPDVRLCGTSGCFMPSPASSPPSLYERLGGRAKLGFSCAIFNSACKST